MKDKNRPKKRVVTDEFGQQFELRSKLGEGGQGVVCKTQFEQVLVKINTQPDKEKKQKWLEHIRWLMRQPLEQLNIAKPFSRIAPTNNGGNVGYALELMDGLIPLQDLMDETEVSMDESEGSPEKYLKTGGIRRRMCLLARLARTLANLHARGMAYGDLSPANIFISKEVEHDQVWLIDCDNICLNQRDSYDQEQVEGQAGRVYSPGYGAPEVVKGEAFVSSLTDSWSFAVIALKLLTTNHPFIGEYVDNGTPDDEEKAFKGELPWIYHPDDFSNEVFKGLPIELVALKPLQAMFEQCFNRGKSEPIARPTLNEWSETFERVSHLLVTCQNKDCNASFNFELAGQTLLCPFCDSEAKNGHVVLVRNILEDQAEGVEGSDRIIDTGYNQTLNLNEEIIVKNSPPGSKYWHESEEVFRLKLTKTELLVAPPLGKEVMLSFGNSKPEVFSKELQLSVSDRKKHWLRLQPKPIEASRKNVISSHWIKW